MMKSKRFELKPFHLLDDEEIETFNAEFVKRDGECHILYMLPEKSIDEMKKVMSEDMHTFVLAFLMDDHLAGLVRVTPCPNHKENGQLGWAIRPSMRCKGYAPIMIRMALQWAEEEFGCSEFTVCIDSKNKASINVARKAGFSMTGNVYHWTNKRISIEFIAKV